MIEKGAFSMSLSSFNWWTWHCARQSELNKGPCKRESTVLRSSEIWAKKCKAEPSELQQIFPSHLSFRTNPYSRTRFSCLVQSLYKSNADVNIWTNSMCWHAVSSHAILIPHLFGLGQLVQVDPSKVRVGEDPRCCLFVATSERNSFNNWSSEQLFLVMFGLNFELLIVSSSACKEFDPKQKDSIELTPGFSATLLWKHEARRQGRKNLDILTRSVWT